MNDLLSKNKPLVIVAGIAVLAVILGLTQPWTKFIDEEVQESSSISITDLAATRQAPLSAAGEAPAAEEQAAASEPLTPNLALSEPMMLDGDEPVAEEQFVEPTTVEEPMPEEVESADGPTVFGVGEFMGRSHPAKGLAAAFETDGQRTLRFEQFETDNGPDLFVYLTRADSQASASAYGVEGDFVNLGRLKGNVGDQNYEIPADVDLSEFDTVVIWCRRFGVAFGAADLV